MLPANETAQVDAAPEESLARWDEPRRTRGGVRADGLTRTLVCGMADRVSSPTCSPRRSVRGVCTSWTAPIRKRCVGGVRADLAHTLFVISSKSGNTVETLGLLPLLHGPGAPRAVRRDHRIRHPLEVLARERRFRAIIPHPPDVGDAIRRSQPLEWSLPRFGNIDGRTLLERTGHTDIAAAKQLGVRLPPRPSLDSISCV